MKRMNCWNWAGPMDPKRTAGRANLRPTPSRRQSTLKKTLVRSLMAAVWAATMLVGSLATAAVVTKSPDLGAYWQEVGYGATEVYADSFVAPSSGTVLELGTWLSYLGGATGGLTFQVYGSVGGNAANGPNLGNVYATTSVLSGLSASTLTYYQFAPLSGSTALIAGDTYWFGVSGLSGTADCYYQVGGHTQNSGGIVDNGTFWYTNSPPSFVGGYTPEMAFSVSVGLAVATSTWNGGGGDANWMTGGNWGGTAPSASNALTFSGTVQLANNNNFPANTQFDGITFDNTAGAFTLNGNTINLAGNIVNAGTNMQTINLNLALQQNVNFSSTSGTLVLGGVVSGSGGIAQTNPGTVILTGSNTYSGGTTLSAGLLQVGSGAALGSGGLSLGGGTLATAAPMTLPMAIALPTSGVSGTINTSGNNVTLSGPLSGSGGFSKVGAGLLSLSNSSSISGSVTVDGGTLQVGTGSLLTTGNYYVGNSAVGAFSQSGGTVGFANTGSYYYPYLYIGYNSNSTGSYTLSNSGLLTAPSNAYGGMYVGYSGTGSFTQSGGTVNLSSISAYVGGFSYGASGSYNLSGNGVANFSSMYVADEFSSGSLNVSGSGALSLYSLSVAGYYAIGTGSLSQNGRVNSSQFTVGNSNGASGTFTQSGGTNAITGSFGLGTTTSSSGSYFLTSGLLNNSGNGEFLGSSSLSNAIVYDTGSLGTGLFQQTGGTNSTNFVWIGNGSSYQYGGGTLQLNSPGGLQVMSGGTLNGNNAVTNLYVPANSILDLSGSLVNTGSMTVTVAANSMVITPSAGFNPNPNGTFLSYTNLGLTHTLGTTLSVAAGQSLSFPGVIVDPVNVQGSFVDPGADNNGLFLTGGLTISGTGNVNVGYDGAVVTSGSGSGMTGGMLGGASHYVGMTGSGVFSQTGGTNTVTGLILGYNSGSNGTYRLSSPGLLSNNYEYIGEYGTGNFVQTGGTNSSSQIYFGMYGNSIGSGTLSGGALSTYTEFIGYDGGTGVFTQAGGTHTVTNLYFSYYGGSSTYNLSNGLLAVSYLYQGGTSTFNFTGGTLQANGSLNTSLPIVLQTAGSNGTFNTNSYTSTLSGPISGSGGLIVAGNGSLYLEGNNSYSGGTNLLAGTLVAGNNLGSATGTGNVILNGGALSSLSSGMIAGAVLAGSGANAIIPGGAVYPSFGTLTIGRLDDEQLNHADLQRGQPARQRQLLRQHDQSVGRLADGGPRQHNRLCHQSRCCGRLSPLRRNLRQPCPEQLLV